MGYKVVYNNCFGGFGLSDKAIALGVELSGNDNWGNYNYSLERHDPILVKVVETLGKQASGFCASLSISEVDGLYLIDEYDGNESVETKDSYDWIDPSK